MADLNANQAAFKLLTDQELTPAEETELRTKLNIASGVDEFSELLDNGTADLPSINVPLSSALSDKVNSGGALGTPSSGDLQNCTFPTLNQSTTGNAATATTPEDINLGKELVQKANYALVRFDSAGSFSHNHPLVNSLASQLGVDVQAVFKLAIKFRNPLYDHFAPEPEI